MKNSFWDRVLIFLYVLLTAALTVLVALRVFGVDLVNCFFDGLSANAPGIIWKLIVCGLGAIIVLLGVYTIITITPSRRRRSDFITLNSDDGGQVRVALPAMREMAKQAISGIEGLDNMNVEVNGEGDSVMVSITMNVVSGTHVPSLTAGIQRAVRTYIESNCGVNVKDVSVVINSVLPGENPAPAPVFQTNAEAAAPSTEETSSWSYTSSSDEPTAFESDTEAAAETSVEEEPAEDEKIGE